MGPRSCSLYSYQDPWRASAFFFAFMQLLLTVLVLVHTVIVCTIYQLMKWYGWGYPSYHDGIYQQDATVSFDLDLAKKGNKIIPLKSTEKILKRSRSEDWRAAKSRSFVCPKCYGLWNLKQSLSFKYDKGTTSQLRETPTLSDTDNSEFGRFSLVEPRTRSNAGYGSRAGISKGCRNSCFERSGSFQSFLNRGLSGKACDGADEPGHGISHHGSVSFNEDVCDTESCSNTPGPNFSRHVKEAATEAEVCEDALGEEVGSSSKESRGNWSSRVPPLKDARSEANLKRSQSTSPILKDLQEETVDEEFAAVPRKEGDDKESSFGSVSKGLSEEQNFDWKYDRKCSDSESVIKGLKEAVIKERKKLCSLYAELEIERISSETAANEAMSMISRLQEEKAALRMQAAHYQRIAEERAIYDEQAVQLLKDILVKKEKENFLLEKEVKTMRIKCCRDVRKYGKRRHGLDKRFLSLDCQGVFLLKNEGEANEGHSPGRKSKGSEEERPSLVPMAEKQPFKRLKGNMHHENLSHTQFPLLGGGGMVHTHDLDPYCSCECEHSGNAIKNNNGGELYDNELAIQEKETVSEEFVQGRKPCLLGSNDNQDFSLQVIEEDFVNKANEGNQFGKCCLKEGEFNCLDNGVIIGAKTFAPCYPDEVSSIIAVPAEETRDFVLECNLRKDLQAIGPVYQAVNCL